MDYEKVRARGPRRWVRECRVINLARHGTIQAGKAREAREG